MMIAALFAWTLIQEAPAQDPKADLAKALKAAAELKAYAYKQTSEMEGGRSASRGPQASEGAWQKDVGLSTKSDKSEAYKVGEDVVYKAEDGTWKKVGKMPSRDDGGGQGGGARPDRSSFRYRNLRAPHESLAGLDAKFKEIKTKTDGDNVVYSGQLTEEAIKEMSQRGGRGGQGGGGGGGDRQLKDAEYDGSAEIWVDKAGHVVKYTITTSTSGKMGDREISMTMTRTVELSKIDEATVTVPEDAKKALTAKGDDF